MNIAELIKDKALKAKAKTEMLSESLLNQKLSVEALLQFASTAKDPVKATCIEALEYASKKQAAIINHEAFEFVCQTLAEKAPRIKMESARVIGNSAHLFPAHLEKAIVNLLDNAEHEGAVVRWSAAFALGEILKLKTSHNQALLAAIDAICANEEKNSIRKIYLDAMKKSK